MNKINSEYFNATYDMDFSDSELNLLLCYYNQLSAHVAKKIYIAEKADEQVNTKKDFIILEKVFEQMRKDSNLFYDANADLLEQVKQVLKKHINGSIGLWYKGGYIDKTYTDADGCEITIRQMIDKNEDIRTFIDEQIKLTSFCTTILKEILSYNNKINPTPNNLQAMYLLDEQPQNEHEAKKLINRISTSSALHNAANALYAGIKNPDEENILFALKKSGRSTTNDGEGSQLVVVNHDGHINKKTRKLDFTHFEEVHINKDIKKYPAIFYAFNFIISKTIELNFDITSPTGLKHDYIKIPTEEFAKACKLTQSEFYRQSSEIINTLTSIKIKYINKRAKTKSTINGAMVLFPTILQEYGYMHISYNVGTQDKLLCWSDYLKENIMIPAYMFKLSMPAQLLMMNILRKHRSSGAKQFKLTCKTLTKYLQLPDINDVEPRNAKRKIANPVEDTIEEIETANISNDDNVKIYFEYIGTVPTKTRDWLTGAYTITIDGEVAKVVNKIKSDAKKKTETMWKNIKNKRDRKEQESTNTEQ